jgi:hypothetical protein
MKVDPVVGAVAKESGDDVKDELSPVDVEEDGGDSVQGTIGHQLRSHIHVYKSIEVVRRFIL